MLERHLKVETETMLAATVLACHFQRPRAGLFDGASCELERPKVQHSQHR